jgi:hypothetical protein
LPTQDTLEKTSPSGQSNQVSEVAAQGSNGQQTSPSGQSAQDENISKLQSKYDSKIAALTKELESSRGLLGQYQQGYTELQRRMDEAEVARAGSDYEKREVEVAQSRRRIAELEGLLAQKAQAEQAQSLRMQNVEKLAKRYGLEGEIDELDRATRSVTEWEDAIDIAIALRDSKKQAKEEAKEERSSANRLDLGGGRVSTSADRLDDEVRKHTVTGTRDSAALMRAQRLAKQAREAATKK